MDFIKVCINSEKVFERLDEVENLSEFDIKIPNLVRSLVGSFAMRNIPQFHSPDGKGYEYVANKIIALDEINPQIAARLVSAFNLYPKLNNELRNLMKLSLDKIAERLIFQKCF